MNDFPSAPQFSLSFKDICCWLFFVIVQVIVNATAVIEDLSHCEKFTFPPRYDGRRKIMIWYYNRPLKPSNVLFSQSNCLSLVHPYFKSLVFEHSDWFSGEGFINESH